MQVTIGAGRKALLVALLAAGGLALVALAQARRYKSSRANQ